MRIPSPHFCDAYVALTGPGIAVGDKTDLVHYTNGMEYFDLIKPGELENLPDDPQIAFARFVEIAQPRLTAKLAEIDERSDNAYEQNQEARYGFQNVVMGAARKYRIEPFAGADMPLRSNYNYDDYHQFRHDLSSYITQIMLTAAEGDRSNSVPLLDNTRSTLKTYVHHLRTAIDNTDLPDATKKRLHEKLDELEAELSRRRVRFVVVASIVMAILSAPGDLVSSYDAVVRITNSIMREIGKAKTADDEHRHISTEEPVALIPSRRHVSPKPANKDGFDRSELDDEIPF